MSANSKSGARAIMIVLNDEKNILEPTRVATFLHLMSMCGNAHLVFLNQSAK